MVIDTQSVEYEYLFKRYSFISMITNKQRRKPPLNPVAEELEEDPG